MRAKTILIVLAVLAGLVALALVAFVATFDANRYKPQLIELVREQTGRELRLDGELSLSLWPRISLATGPASVSGPGGQGEAARFQAGKVAVAIGPLLSRQLVVEGLTLEGLSAGLAAAEEGAGWRLEDTAVHMGRIASGESGRLEVDGKLVAADGSGAGQLEIESGYEPDFSNRRLRLAGLEASLTGASGSLAGLQARLNGDVAADLASSRIDANRLALDAAFAGGARLALAGAGKADLKAGNAELALEGTLDESKLQLQANAAKLDPLALSYKLAADQLDVDRLRTRFGAPATATATPPSPAGADAPAAPPVAGSQAPAASAGGSPFAAIGALDTKGTLTVGRLKVAGLTISELSARAVTGNERIVVDPLEGRLNEGSARASVTLADAGHHLKSTLSGVDVGALVRDAAARDVVEGRGDLTLDVGARGQTADALTRSLSGAASVALRQGAVKGVDLDKLLQAVRGALDGKVPVVQRPQSGDRTPFSSLTASFKLGNGVARSEDLDLRADWVHARGAGQADLGARTLDWLIKATLTGSDAARKETLSRLQGLTVPIRLSGSFDDPSYRVEVADLIGDAVKREAQRRIEKELGERLGLPKPGGSGEERGGESKPLDQLRDLFRR